MGYTNGNGKPSWVSTWGASIDDDYWFPQLTVTNRTVREIAHISVGGDKVQVRLSSLPSDVPVVIGAASVGVRDSNADIVTGTLRKLKFGGKKSCAILPGTTVISDAVELKVEAGEDLAVSLYLTSLDGPPAYHALAWQTNYVSPPGNFTMSLSMPVAETMTSWLWLSGIDVRTRQNEGCVVCFGDSLTEGNNSTMDANNRYPDELFRLLWADFGSRFGSSIRDKWGSRDKPQSLWARNAAPAG